MLSWRFGMTERDVLLIRGEVPNLMLGAIFVFVGLVALAVAAIRHRREFLVLLWGGCFIGMYGLRLLEQAIVALSLAPRSSWPDRLDVFITYMLVVPGTLFWVELTVGWVRRFVQWVSAIAFGIGLIGLIYYATTGSPDKVLALNNLLAIVLLIAVGVFVLIPKLSRRYLLVQSRVLVVCLPVITMAGLYYNSSRFLHFEPWKIEPAAFGIWILALVYVAAERVFANERRLLAIDSELETARQIQVSILPRRVPILQNLRIAAAYEPMSAVAGDFYDFIQVDDHRLGVLVADVTGHGVPAALISSMIKVAMQSVSAFAADPARVLMELNRILSPEVRGQLISAAYLWIDSEHRCARYSAAGHPPLLYWRELQGELRQVESNGLLFGVSEETEYPAVSLALQPQDRMLLYTDGIIEPESSAGEAFGGRRLGEVVRAYVARPGSELSGAILSELRNWLPPSASPQDDMTLIVIDVL